MNTNYNREAFVRSLEKLSLQGRMRNVKEAFPAESITPVLASTAFCYQNARLLVAMPLIPRRTAKRKEVISNG